MGELEIMYKGICQFECIKRQVERDKHKLEWLDFEVLGNKMVSLTMVRLHLEDL